MNSSDRAAEGVPSLSSTRSAAHSWIAALRLALLDLRDPSPKMLTQRQVRSLNQCGRLLRDCFGDGELLLRTTDEKRQLVWAIYRDAEPLLLGDQSCWNRRGELRPQRLIRAIRRRVRLQRELRKLEQSSLLEDALDSVNGTLMEVR